MDGCLKLVLGNEDKALQDLEQATSLADGTFLAGFLAFKDRLVEAATSVATAAEKHSRLGRYFSTYGISAAISLPITDEVSAHVGPDLRGMLLELVKVYQRQERWADAIACQERRKRIQAEDMVVKLSLAELLLHTRAGEKNACRRIVRLAGGIEDETSVHPPLLSYKARALRGLGLLIAARETLTSAPSRREARFVELPRALRYKGVLVYEDLGQRQRPRSEIEKLYAEVPNYKDVAARLGLCQAVPRNCGTSC